MAEESLTFNVHQIARMYNIPAYIINRDMNAGRLDHYRFSQKTKVATRAAISAWLKKYHPHCVDAAVEPPAPTKPSRRRQSGLLPAGEDDIRRVSRAFSRL